MSSQLTGIKKGQQLTMPISQGDNTPDLLNGCRMEAIDIRSHWKDLLPIIYRNEFVQNMMEKSYQEFQEGIKLKEFKHKDALKGAWSFQDIHQGIYPYTLTTNNWVFEYEEKEWEAQASEIDKEAMLSIQDTLEKCKKVEGNIDILHGLDEAYQYLLQKYSPRPTQPETWRPQNAAHWVVKWVKVLAEIYYSNLSDDWRIIANSNHAIVAGFTKNITVYLFDIILLTTNPQEIVNALK